VGMISSLNVQEGIFNFFKNNEIKIYILTLYFKLVVFRLQTLSVRAIFDSSFRKFMSR
jgi:hypothetical protein